LEDERLWTRFRAVAGVGADAWPALVEALDPVLEVLARRQPIGRLRDREDTPREIVTRTLQRLHAREFATVKKLCAIDPPPELRAYLRLIVKRAAIDYMRESPEYQRKAAAWISLATLSSGAPSPGPNSLADKRREVTAFVAAMVARATEAGDSGQLAIAWKVESIHVRRLVQRGEQYLEVLAAVLSGQSHSEAAAALGMTKREVELTVRYIEELLEARGFGR
jgi:DNA-directed RNA polymerase specialized sigma24 family protein